MSAPSLLVLHEKKINDRIQGMEDLIKQCFLHIEVIEPHVAEGHYDLVGPNGDIILPEVWENVIEPDMIITMHMWPVPEKTEEPETDLDATYNASNLPTSDTPDISKLILKATFSSFCLRSNLVFNSPAMVNTIWSLGIVKEERSLAGQMTTPNQQISSNAK
jgi:hypothetical protein